MRLTRTTIGTAGGSVDVLRGGHGIKVVCVLPAKEFNAHVALVEELATRFEVFALAGAPLAPGRAPWVQLDDALDALTLINVPVIGIGAAAAVVVDLAMWSRQRVAKLVLLDVALTDDQRAATYRVLAPTLIIDAMGTTASRAASALDAANLRSAAAIELVGATPAAYANAIETHLRDKAPGANDGLLIAHVDDLPWHEVRVMNVNGVRSVVKNRFVDFGEHRTICHTWYDPGIALAKHSHMTEELIYVLSGGIHIGDVWCPEGTCIVLSPGTYFGPLVAGPDGAYLLEAFPGIGIRAGQDRAGFDELAAQIGVEPLPDPPFNPPAAAK